MARVVRTARRRLGPRATPASIIFEYRTYGMVYGDDIGEFLAHYRRLWEAAHRHGVTDYDGIRRLLTRLPSDWEGYAREVSGDYIYRGAEFHDLEGDLPRFVSHLEYVFGVYGAAPMGPYLLPREFTWRDETTEWLYMEVPQTTGYTFTLVQPAVRRNDHEAGPSRPVARTYPVPPQFMFGPQPPPIPTAPPMPIPPPPADPFQLPSHLRVVEHDDGHGVVRDIYAVVAASPLQSPPQTPPPMYDGDEEEDPEEYMGSPSSTGSQEP